MNEPSTAAITHEIPFEAFGVRVLVRMVGEDALERVKALLPPGWRPCPTADVEKRFSVVHDEHGRYEFYRGDYQFARGLHLDHALTLLEAQVRAHVALHAPDFIFVHAGVVASRGKAIVLPGLSFAGKTTLVAALVRAGAVYYSDEFAVLDEDGMVHPYGKPLSLRDGSLAQIDQSVQSLGGTQGNDPVRIGAIVFTRYRPGAKWEPTDSSPGEGVMALLANTIAAQERPPEVMRALTRAAEGARVIQGERGDADEIAGQLLALVED